MQRKRLAALVLAVAALTWLSLALASRTPSPADTTPALPPEHFVASEAPQTLLFPPRGAERILVGTLLGGTLVVFLAHAWTRRMRLRTWPRRFAVVALAVSVIGLTEYSIRSHCASHHPTVFVPDADLMWRLTPNLTHLQYFERASLNTNALGLRGPAVLREKPAHTERILLLGDSTLFGHGENEGDTCRDHLQALLADARRPQHVEVLNAAVPGYSSFQGLEFLRSKGLALHPDWVVVGFNNDAGPADISDRQSMEQPAWARWVKRGLYQSSLYLVLRKIYLQHALAQKTVSTPASRGPAFSQPATQRVPIGDAAAILEEMAALCRAHGAGLTVVILPRNRTLTRFFSVGYREAMLATAARLGVATVDLYTAWSGPDDAALFFPGDAIHPNPAGQARLARDLCAALCTQWRKSPRASAP